MPLTRHQAAVDSAQHSRKSEDVAQVLPNGQHHSGKRRRLGEVPSEQIRSKQTTQSSDGRTFRELDRTSSHLNTEDRTRSTDDHVTVAQNDAGRANIVLLEYEPSPETRPEVLNLLDAADDAATDFLLQLSAWSIHDTKKILRASHPIHPQCLADLSRLSSELRPQRREKENTDNVFIPEASLGSKSSSNSSVLRRINLAQFIYGIFSQQISLDQLEPRFMEIFVPPNGRLLKPLGSLLLELKTQVLIRASNGSEGDFLDRLFSNEVEKEILARRLSTTSLFPSERDFMRRLKSRRDILTSDISDSRAIELPERYKWDDFLYQLHVFVSKNISSLVPGKDSRSQTAGQPLPAKTNSLTFTAPAVGQFSIYDPPEASKPGETTKIGGTSIATFTPLAGASPKSREEDFVAKAARAAQIALHGPSGASAVRKPPVSPVLTPAVSSKHRVTAGQLVPAVFQHYNPSKALSSSPRTSGVSMPTPNDDEIVPHPSQSAPTHILYHRACQNTPSKSAVHTISTPPPVSFTTSSRRPWNVNEEATLMQGLDQVRGPHWSAILALYGPGGTMNEVLKDRNQIQLKDKARNLKLFFLKASTEVPYYLNQVTGDISRRLPTKSSKRSHTSDSNNLK